MNQAFVSYSPARFQKAAKRKKRMEEPMNYKVNSLIAVFVSCLCVNGLAQKHAFKPDLSDIKVFNVVNREIALSKEQGKDVIHLDGKPNNGVAWINNLNFEKGVIELDVKGKNVAQQSFVGIAFHGLNDSTFEAVYFRPFNFQSPEPERKGHSVQYVSLPRYDWSVLRQTYPGKYENALSGTVDPESWFHAKIQVEGGNITVFVNHDSKASLVIKPLADRTNGKIGFWVGNNSDGDFANLTIDQ
jgi:hypothetical protein